MPTLPQSPITLPVPLGQYNLDDSAGRKLFQNSLTQYLAQQVQTTLQSLSSTLSASIVSLVPTGTVLDFAGSTAPTGFVLCNGASLATTGTYAALFAVIGYTYGGSGATFNVPDLRGRMPIGAGLGSGLTNRVLGASGGEETHQLTIAELASHGHTISPDPHVHLHGYTNILYAGGGGSVNALVSSGGTPVNGNSTSLSATANGSNTAHNTMAPFVVLNKIIKT